MDGWMDGWTDGWMDGEVLIIGMMVGWSGGVPNGLPCDGSRVRGLISIASDFHSFFWKAFFFGFFRSWVDFGRFWEAKTEAKIEFSGSCLHCAFFDRLLESI